MQAWGLDGVPEVAEGDDLVTLLLEALSTTGLQVADGDVLTVTSKVVSKAEGATSVGDRATAIDGDTVDVVARRGPTSIVRTRHGLVLAAAGIDASNVTPGTLVHLPLDPDASARRLRDALGRRTGRRVAVVITDTAGRPWRLGQTDLAIGVAGLRVLDDHAGREDTHGNPLSVTAPAVADEVAATAELVTRKTGGRPFCLVRGLDTHVLDEAGPGAASLVRSRRLDMFALGAREAVVAACTAHPPDAFGAPVDVVEMVHRLADLAEPAVVGCEVTRVAGGLLVATEAPVEPSALLAQGTLLGDVARVATAHGWGVGDRSESHEGDTYAVAVRLTPR
ncbi:coenzyme F420-0:L-glutamate ligase [Nocardioidaceae bacterium]|nr:coenzyme F420-0:L-glutamate ligase [Nocardioidaceae bacterium]